eukprot:Plantae.Rhodophyta-Palmaria_palmata.ctg227.p1 GENE.Plantae.Rhodophyta-Palmaria_palmata.ctg227~~Plantae.Rhodophyta-Palmaria_palmata.ctg227.p1  ORF type:complete len:482 (+),score=82.80 Plantae.Rhodophyta-Palmaria_palmata.ctg227:153-1598(+)
MGILKEQVLSDFEGSALIKTRRWGKRTTCFVRVHGGVITMQQTKHADVDWDACLLKCKVTTVRRNSFHLILRSGRKFYFLVQAENVTSWADALRRASSHRLEEKFEIAEEIAHGSSARVYRAVNKMSGEEVAVKSIARPRFGTEESNYLAREELVSTMLNIPGVVTTKEVFHNQTMVHLVMELMRGGSLFQLLQIECGCKSLEIAKRILKELLEAVDGMHDKGVVHRDVKLDNIFCQSNDLKSTAIALGDFGFSKLIGAGQERSTSFVGTLPYMAPEIILGDPYGAEVDIWAVGVVAYVLMGGCFPYYFEGDEEATMEAVVGGDLQFEENQWKDVDETYKLFVCNLLELDPHHRLTAKEALQHEFFVCGKDVDAGKSSCSDKLARDINAFCRLGSKECDGESSDEEGSLGVEPEIKKTLSTGIEAGDARKNAYSKEMDGKSEVQNGEISRSRSAHAGVVEKHSCLHKLCHIFKRGFQKTEK